MAKGKRRQGISNPKNSPTNYKPVEPSRLYNGERFSSHVFRARERLKPPQTRDFKNPVANRRLSFAEDLRLYTPDRKKFKNVDGSIAETTYKPVPVQKKSILYRLVICGAMCLVSFILGVLASASVEVYANKYYSLLKIW